jgi:hypothetical protein
VSATSTEISAPSEPAWCYETSRFVAFGFDFSVRVMDAELGGFLDEAWSATAAPGEPAHRYLLTDLGPGAEQRFRLDCDDVQIGEVRRPSQAVGMLCWHVNRQIVMHRGAHLVLHAAAAEHRGRGLIIPAAMESGKTTLVAGLTRAGLRYLTDEAVFIEPTSLFVRPYPKPLSIDPGSWPVLPELRPRVSAAVEPYLEKQWQVAPGSIGPDSVGETCPPAWIVTTSYQADQPTRLEPMSASEAVITLARNTFDFDTDPRRHLDLIAGVVRQCRRHRLIVSDLDRACELVLALLEEP